MAEEPKQPRSAIAPLAHRRGGPATFSGVNYQVRVGVWHALLWLHEANQQPVAVDVFRTEPREFVEDGQLGFDVGRTSEARVEMVEAKEKPSKDDVVEFVRSAAVFADLVDGKRQQSSTYGLVSESRTVWSDSLVRLWGYGREAATDGELVDIVRRHAKAHDRTLLNELGATPLRVLQVMAKPTYLPEQAVEAISRVLASYLAPAGRSDALRTRLTELVQEGSGHRLSIPLGDLVRDLAEADLLAPPPAVDTSTADPALVAAISVLQECPVSLPGAVLAQGLGKSEDELVVLLGEHLQHGGATLDDAGRFYAPPRVGPRLHPVVDALAGTLASLIRYAEREREMYAHQAMNALALSEACLSTRPNVVAPVFVAFDKAVKAWGDLQLTFRLAEVATQAIDHALSSVEDEREQAVLVQRKVHTKVCGQSWVLQRVDRLADSHRHLREANELTATFHDPANHAFGLKCEGRILRMRAEALPVSDPDREELLAASEAKLRDGFAAFDGLLPTASRHYEDHGECLSLLGRTLASAGRHDEAADVVRRAETILKAKLTSKAYADLVILKGDLLLIDMEDAGADGELGDADTARAQDMLRTVDDLIAVHDESVTERFTPGSSEIAARARVLAGRLNQRIGLGAAAEGRYREAAEVYDHLRYPGAHADALWRAEVISEEGIPDGLRRVFKEADTPTDIRVLALQRWRNEAPRGDQQGRAEPAPDSPVWSGYVTEATRTGLARKSKWGEARPA